MRFGSVCLILWALAISAIQGQSADPLIGSYRLVAASATDARGVVDTTPYQPVVKV